MDENTEHRAHIPQHIIGTAANDHTASLLCHRADGITFCQKHLIGHSLVPGIAVAAGGQIEQQAVDKPALLPRQKLRRQTAALHRPVDIVPVIIRHAELLRQLLANMAAAAAVFPADDDNLLCVHALIPSLCALRIDFTLNRRRCQ